MIFYVLIFAKAKFIITVCAAAERRNGDQIEDIASKLRI